MSALLLSGTRLTHQATYTRSAHIMSINVKLASLQMEWKYQCNTKSFCMIWMLNIEPTKVIKILNEKTPFILHSNKPWFLPHSVCKLSE